MRDLRGFTVASCRAHLAGNRTMDGTGWGDGWLVVKARRWAGGETVSGAMPTSLLPPGLASRELLDPIAALAVAGPAMATMAVGTPAAVPLLPTLVEGAASQSLKLAGLSKYHPIRST